MVFMPIQIMLLFVYTTTCKRFVIFTCRYFRLSWNTTALSQSNCRKFSFSSIKKIKYNYSRVLLFICTDVRNQTRCCVSSEIYRHQDRLKKRGTVLLAWKFLDIRWKAVLSVGLKSWNWGKFTSWPAYISFTE